MGLRLSWPPFAVTRPTAKPLVQKLEDIDQLATQALADPFVHRGHTLTAIREIARKR